MKESTREEGTKLIDKWIEENPVLGEMMVRVFAIKDEIEDLERSMANYIRNECQDETVRFYVKRIESLQEEEDRLTEEHEKLFKGEVKESAAELVRKLMVGMLDEEDEEDEE